MTLYSDGDYRRLAVAPAFSTPPLPSPFREDVKRLTHSPVFRRLQGKTQLFPGAESDFFRNRLTHSLEVAQIAGDIADKINREEGLGLDLSLVQFAALAHDLGHPPFGHVGERKLNQLMAKHGGFEGNAQTFRILTKLEKKSIEHTSASSEDPGQSLPPLVTDTGVDCRRGLDLTSRALAAILKYDQAIPELQDVAERKKTKGIYWTEEDARLKVRMNVDPSLSDSSKLRVIECNIMDVADDIAYSVYDLEDILKAGFLSPIKVISADQSLLAKVASEVRKELGINKESDFGPKKVRKILVDIFHSISDVRGLDKLLEQRNNGDTSQDESIEVQEEGLGATVAIFASNMSENLAKRGYNRTHFIAELVHAFVEGVYVDKSVNQDPRFWAVALKDDVRRKVEVLKHLAFQSIVTSPRLSVVEHRAEQIVEDLFETVREKPHLMPADFQELYNSFRPNHCSGVSQRMRVVCDFIAGMTDRFAVEFYGRIRSEHPESMFKPFF